MATITQHPLWRRETQSTKPAEPTAVQNWINQCVELCQPEKIHVCTGSEQEAQGFD